MDVDSFSPGQDALSKSPAPTHGLAGQATAWMPELRQRRSGCPMPGKRQAGWPSLLVTFLLATQEKSDSVA
ncbi:MAG: hypothetical protein WBG85_04985, partial [Rhodanobacter sp.]